MKTLSPPPGKPFDRLVIAVEADVFRSRQAVGRAMDRLGAQVIRKTRLVTAVSEVFRNGLIYGGGAEVVITLDESDRMVWVDCTDQGPGIADLERAMKDGYTSGKGLGRGLGGAKRLSDHFEIHSVLGEGTQVRLAGRA